ncbi:hypothetical protein OH76DRAFT_1487477 [Lentinus brumalis]|uniref:Xylosidase/arabinosidase n=1 Tax=Lentinus brumalis TaxID=2498619 RepID=A0A371CUG0_9APHY|nr:hypothetical protein OH76DRAFT_1487477 [Polyporus brumalis]
MASSSSRGKTLKRADPSTIHDKFLVGYQGWFTCAGDGQPVGPGHHGWLHWFNYPIPDGGRPNTDLWPDVSDYTPSELFPAPGLKHANGEQAFLFSSRHPKTVQRHFHWMAQHGVDGAFLQRFLGQCDLEQGNEGIRKLRDEVGDRVMEAAEKEGRVFAIMYDVSGVAPDRIQRVLEHDWIHLIRRKAILDSPAYLREQGRPVVALWGFGMSDAHHSPATVRAITRFIRNNTPGGAYIMAGVPAHWRTSVMDADPNPEFVRVYMEDFDAISPWTIGRFSDEAGADRFEEEKIKGDVDFIKQHNDRWENNRGSMRKIDYIPVVFPGGSGYNLSEGKWSWNDCPRKGGHFMWRQLFNVRRHNVRTVYGAMWDEYDEGTAFMPVVSHKRQVPVHDKYRFMALDEDGFDLPPDWYMRICGFAAEGLRGDRLILGTFPSKELQDYWSTRPRYEPEPGPSSAGGSGSSEVKGESWEDWEKLTQNKGGGDEPPPPPYSLEAEEPQNQPASSGPPPVPLGRRPSTQSQAPSAPVSTRPAHPAVHSGSRPQSFAESSTGPRVTSHPNSPLHSPLHVPTDEFSHLGISPSMPSSPRPGQGYNGLHSHSPSPRPVSPAHSHHSHHSHTSSHSVSGPLPPTEPGFAFPSPSVAPPLAPSGPPGPWSQAQWPPPEWNRPQGPTAVIEQFFHRDEQPQNVQTATHHQSGYAPSYLSGHQSGTTSPPPPPLRPRPSLAHHSRPPASPTRDDYGHGSHDNVGGFAFPEAHVPAADNNFYGTPSFPSSPYNAPAPQESTYYSGTGQPMSFPHAAGPAPPPPPRPYGYGNASMQDEYYTPMAPEAHAIGRPGNYPAPSAPHAAYGGPPSQTFSPPPPPPPAHNRPPQTAGYSGNQGPGFSGGGPLGQALNLVGNVAGQGAKNSIQNLASSGTKLFSKYRR